MWKGGDGSFDDFSNDSVGSVEVFFTILDPQCICIDSEYTKNNTNSNSTRVGNSKNRRFIEIFVPLNTADENKMMRYFEFERNFSHLSQTIEFISIYLISNWNFGLIAATKITYFTWRVRECRMKPSNRSAFHLPILLMFDCLQSSNYDDTQGVSKYCYDVRFPSNQFCKFESDQWKTKKKWLMKFCTQKCS